MIYDRLSNIEKYLGIHENLDLALTYIRDNLDTMPESIELKGQDVRAFFNEYETAPEEECFFEAHASFADIQIMRSGAERIAVSSLDALTVTAAKRGFQHRSVQGGLFIKLLEYTGKMHL